MVRDKPFKHFNLDLYATILSLCKKIEANMVTFNG